MKSKILFIALLVLAAPVFADQCLTSIDGTTSVTTNVTTGTSVQISVTPSGSCSSGEATVQLTYSNCSLSITDPSSPGYYSGVSTGTAKTFTVTSGSAGVCTITARGSTSDGSVDDNSPVILEFVDPSILTVDGAPNSASVTHNNNFTLGINITNSQTADVLTSYVLTIPSGLERLDGDSESGSRTVYGSSVKPLSWIIKHSTCFTGTKTITFQLGDNTNAFSADVSGNSSCSSGSSSTNSSSSSNGIGGANATTKETKTFSAAAGTKQILAFTTITSPGITQIELTLANAVVAANISLSSASKPSGAADPVASSNGTVYSYSNITLTNALNTDFSIIKIKFKVPSVWVSANNIDYQKVYLYRYVNSAWNRLTTTFKSNDSSNYFYEADTPGFSTFSVAGFKSGSVVPTSTIGAGPSISVISPTLNMKINGSRVVIQLSASGITLAEPKGNVVAGEAHFHVWIDDSNEQQSAGTTFTFENVSIGEHTLKVELRNGNHSSLSPPVLTITRFEVVAPGQTVAAPSVDFAWGFVILIALVVAAAVYFFKVKHISMKSAKYYAHKSAEKIQDFMPQHIRDASMKDAKPVASPISAFFKTLHQIKMPDFAPKNTNAASNVSEVSNAVPEKKKEEPEGDYKFAS